MNHDERESKPKETGVVSFLQNIYKIIGTFWAMQKAYNPLELVLTN